MTENGITTKLTYVFSVISKQRRSVTEKSPKKQVETQSSKMFLIFRTTPLVVRCIPAASLVATAL